MAWAQHNAEGKAPQVGVNGKVSRFHPAADCVLKDVSLCKSQSNDLAFPTLSREVGESLDF